MTKIKDFTDLTAWKKLKRTLVLIDSSNVIFSLKDLGWKLDYKKLQKFFAKRTKLVDIYLYSAYFENKAKQKDFLEMCSRKGFIIRTKQVKKIKIKGGFVYKGNLDTELVIDAIDRKSDYDTLVLLSGDSDFAPLIDYLHKHDKKVISISSRGHVSREIIQASDAYLWLEYFSKHWKLKQKVKFTKPRFRRALDELSSKRIAKKINEVK